MVTAFLLGGPRDGDSIDAVVCPTVEVAWTCGAPGCPAFVTHVYKRRPDPRHGPVRAAATIYDYAGENPRHAHPTEDTNA